MKTFRKIFLFCLIIFLLLTIKSFAVGEIIEFDGITITMPEVSLGINDLEDAKSPINSIKFSISDTGQDDHRESISEIIAKFEKGTDVVGIDVSQHNGDIDWSQVAASGVKFAMIRVAGRGYGEAGNLYEDKLFEKNIEGAIANGIAVGVYFYSTANTDEEALEEAAVTVGLIEPYKDKITFPVAFDFEEFNNDNRNRGLSKEQLEKNTKIFLDYVNLSGYKACIYSSASFLKTKWDMSKFADYGTWVANWYVTKPDYNAKYEMWQYSNAGRVPGISTYVDVNVDYKYYAEQQGYLDEPEEIDWSSNPPSVSVQVHAEDYGWMNYVKDGQTAGTTGESKRLEAMKIKLDSQLVSGGIEYRSHVQDIGWEYGWKTSDQVTGTTGMSRRVEAIQIKLTGDISKYFDIYYRTHVQNFGWLGWAKNGESSGTEGRSIRIEAIQVKLVLKSDPAPSGIETEFINVPMIRYRSHVQDIGWMGYSKNGQLSGTTGQAKRVEAMNINLVDNRIGGGIEYRSHVEDYGWSNELVKDGALTGTTGQEKRLEALQIRLYGEVAVYYDIYYRVHVADFGWLGWAKNGEIAGTTGLAKRIEAIEIVLVPSAGAAPGSTINSHIS